MSTTLKDRNEKDDLKEIPIGIKWEWDEENRCLTFKKSGQPRFVKQERQKTEGNSRSELRKQANSDISVSDVKNAALNMVSERYYIPNEFENFCNEKNSKLILEDFLLNLANYFYWFFEKIDASVSTNPLCIERSQSEQERIENADKMIKKMLKSLAKGYCMLILGLGSTEHHHMQCGRLKASSSFKDRGLYETLYPFCVYFVWITFSRRDYEIIRQEVGRILKSDAFNNSMRIESLLDEDTEANENAAKLKINDNELILKQFESNKMTVDDQKNLVKRPAPATILSQRSPAVVSLLPLPQEKSKKLFDRKAVEHIEDILDEDREEALTPDENGVPTLMLRVGIIGQPARLFNMKTLAPRGTVEDEGTGEAKNDGGSSMERQASHLTNQEQQNNNQADTARTLSQLSRPTTVASNISVP